MYVVPPRLCVSKQSKIVEEALRIRQVTTTLEALALQENSRCREKLFRLEEVSRKFLNFSENTEKAFYQTLPFPIAVVYRKIVNAPNSTQRFSLLIELFEVVVRFIVLVNLADYLSNPKEAEAMIQEIPDIGRLSAPTLGDWVSLFNSLSHHFTSPDNRPFLEEIKDFRLERYTRTLREFVNIRNDSLRGHGSTLTEAEYEIKFQEHSPKLYKLMDELGFLANYRLVKTATMEKHGEFFKISVQNLMGDNPHFTNDHVLLRTPLDTNKVLYLNAKGESLVLDPYVVLELCPECKRPEVLLLAQVYRAENHVSCLRERPQAVVFHQRSTAFCSSRTRFTPVLSQALKRQLHPVELLFCFLRRLQILLGRRKRLVTEPLLYGPDVNSRSQPAGCSGIAKTMQVPLLRVEPGPFGDVLAALMQEPVVESGSCGDGKTNGQFRDVRVLLRRISATSVRRGRCALPSLSAGTRIAVLP